MSVVLITGCNSGFGMAGALAFARRGDTVYGTVREPGRGEPLMARAGAEGLTVHLQTLDVTRPASFPALVEKVVREQGRLDVLVNNAGILLPGAFEDLDEAAIRQVMETNFFGPMLLSRAVLPQMRKQGGGCIIMISSLSGLAGLAGDVAYTASKFALEGATEALRHEVDRWGIRLALVEPGQYQTDLFRNMDGLPQNYPANSPYRPLVERKLKETRDGQPDAMPASQVGDLLPLIADADGSRLRWPADDVARHVLGSVHGQNDAERDTFLRGAGGSDWWSDGLDPPDETATGGD
jgi:NAD(P)-dependent dehydrogenase (short-subunit alcohol dehydrogenase family)